MGAYITRLKDFADTLFDKTYSTMSEDEKDFVMKAARTMNFGGDKRASGIKIEEVKNADSPRPKTDEDSLNRN
jgi:hypothetical protein